MLRNWVCDNWVYQFPIKKIILAGGPKLISVTGIPGHTVAPKLITDRHIFC